MQAPVDIRYAGVPVARGVSIRDADEAGLFVVMADPLPVGTLVELAGRDAAVPARVERVVESSAPDAAGMRLRPVGELGIKIDIQGAAVALATDSPPALSRSKEPIAPSLDPRRQTKMMFGVPAAAHPSAPRAPDAPPPPTASPAPAPARATVEDASDLPLPVSPSSPGHALPEVFATVEKTPPPELMPPPASGSTAAPSAAAVASAGATATAPSAPTSAGGPQAGSTKPAPAAEPLGPARPIEGAGKRARRRKR